MNKKNILLTIWLLLPITIVSLLMVWIFYSLDKDRLMDDAVPYGAGAGDTGNANAIGEWLAGNDADQISLAVKARREGVAIDPREWPGGIDLRVQIIEIGKIQKDWYLELRSDAGAEMVLVQAGPSINGWYSIVLSHEQVSGATVWLGEGADNVGQRQYIKSQVPDPNLQTTDPMAVETTWKSP